MSNAPRLYGTSFRNRCTQQYACQMCCVAPGASRMSREIPAGPRLFHRRRVLVQPPLRRRPVSSACIAGRRRRLMLVCTCRVGRAPVLLRACPACSLVPGSSVGYVWLGGIVGAPLRSRRAPAAAAAVLAAARALHGRAPQLERLLPLGAPPQVHVQHLLVVIQRLLHSSAASVWVHPEPRCLSAEKNTAC